ncbi:hypothetical protein niasHT_019238 [Heterodera trifolii]|uniref:Uncharacterized protein n=1 Tax=Heterodera trifolii TaxID=157864 RepID=A0ABD2L0Q5_9BILA
MSHGLPDNRTVDNRTVDNRTVGQSDSEDNRTEVDNRTVDKPTELLKPTEEVSLHYCKETLSARIPLAHTLVSTLEQVDLSLTIDGEIKIINEVEEMRTRLIEAVKKRFLQKENRLCMLSTFLDPRFKDRFSDESEIFFARVSRFLKDEGAEENDILENLEEEVNSTRISPPAKRAYSIVEIMQNIASCTKATSSQNKSMSEEILTYKEDICVFMNVDPLQWWNSNERKFS